jgi:hypothetical protein
VITRFASCFSSWPRSVPSDCESERSDPTLRRLTAYIEKLYDLSRIAASHLVDGRRRPHVPILDVFRCAFLMFAQRLPSLNALEEVLRRRGKPFVEKAVPSADTLGYAYERLDPGGLRAMLKHVCAMGRRNKSLQRRNSSRPWVLALDGHELFASFKRCCPKCSKRRVKTENGETIQYFHRTATAQLVDVSPPISIDAELIGPGEGETVAGRRLVDRVLKEFPFVSVVTMDALYLEAPIVRQIVEAGKGAVVVLKQENRQLYQEAMALTAAIQPQQGDVRGVPTKIWDVKDIRHWEGMEDIPIRVVRSETTRTIRERIANQWVEKVETSTWMWAVAGTACELSAVEICRIGHNRWDIENLGYNVMDRYLALDHCFKHASQAIINFILTLFLAAVLTESFLRRNLKPQLRNRMTLAGLARLLLEAVVGKLSTCLWKTPDSS